MTGCRRCKAASAAESLRQKDGSLNYIIRIVSDRRWMTFVRTRFVQVRCFGEGMKKVFGNLSLHGGKQNGGISSFQALTTAVAAQVGTGNIVGACGAILIGGPGAIFWMCIIAFFGMATIYAEAVLAQETRTVDTDGNAVGGPVYYIRKAFPDSLGKFLAGFFSVAIILALGFFGCMVQSNSIAESGTNAFGIPGWIIGIIVAAGAGLIFIGGGIGYALKTAVSQGVKRGLFSNEAGMGSTPHAHALAKVAKPHDQGVVAIVGVFIDTFVVLTMTALVVISTLYTADGVLASGAADGVAKTNMAQLAFGKVFGSGFGSSFVAVCLLFFAFSTILGWNLFGKVNMEYLFGRKSVPVYSVIAIVFIFLGSLLSNDFVWELTDMFNQLMVIPNVIALIALAAIVTATARSGEEEWKKTREVSDRYTIS